MHIKYRDRETGAITVAVFERYTMSRTMRRYSRHEIVGADLSGSPIRLAGFNERPNVILIRF